MLYRAKAIKDMYVYVIGSPKDDLLNRPYLKKDDKGGGAKISPILRRHSLWTTP